MIEIRRSEDRGHADHGWLDTFHTFSFADYHDPSFVHFGPLRVLNQDRVAAGRGFPTHGHADMEIVTYVLDGVLEHEDSMGNGSRMQSGDVQLMSAGSGVTHSEFNGSETDALHFLQMWIFPKTQGSAPRYEQRTFPAAERQGRLRLVVSEDGSEGSVSIDQDARLFAGLLAPGEGAQLALSPGRIAWVHVARGSVRLGDHELNAGDGAAVRGEERIALEGREAAEVLVWELPQ